MTKAAFEWWFAAQRNTTVTQLYESGRHAVPCKCGDPWCKGWVMVVVKPKQQKEDTCQH